MNDVKIVLVGDDAVGKTSLAITFSTGDSPNDYIPTVSDTIVENLVIDGEQVKQFFSDALKTKNLYIL